MANPNPIFVSPSTTVVQVNPLLTPYTPVILNGYSYTGQVVTVLDGTSSFGAVYSNIVVSTGGASVFTDGSVSTLINQPQGFLTVQAGSPNLWTVLNSFPFRNQYVSAGTQNLTVSTLFTQSLSTAREVTNFVTVENLQVSGNLSISSAVTLNQTISSLGTVNFFSTLTTSGNTLFSSALSTVGAVWFASTLTVNGSLTTPSSLQFRSTVFVSGSVLAQGLLSTSLVSLSGSLATYRLIAQTSSPTSVNVAGSLTATTFINALSSLYAGGSLTSQTTTAKQFSTLSSAAIATGLTAQQDAVFQSHVSTHRTFGVAGNLSTVKDVLVTGDLTVGSNLFVGRSTTVNGFVSTNEFLAKSLAVYGNFQVDPTKSNVSRVESLTINQSFGFGSLVATSTTIGGSLSTPSFLFLSGNVLGSSTFTTLQQMQTLSSFSTLGDISVVGMLSSLSNVFVSAGVTVQSNFDTVNSFWNASNVSSSLIRGNLSIVKNLTITQTLIVSSIVLPSSVTANNFEVSSLNVAYRGIVNDITISTLKTSSIGTGGILFPQAPMDMSNDLYTYNLSSFLLSSLEFQARSGGNLVVPSTFFQATSSFGVRTTASTNTFDVNTIGYTLSNTYVAKNLSSLTVFGETMSGILSGDGRLLSNVSFPQTLSTNNIRTSTLRAQRLEAVSTFVSTIFTDYFLPRSTLTVTQFSIFGNARNNPSLSTNYIAAPTATPNLLYLNNFALYGDTAGVVTKQAVLNSTFLTVPNTYSLAVGRTLRVDNIISPNFSLPAVSLQGDIVVTRAFSSLSLNVSSGILGLGTGTLFIPESASVVTRSTNTIQPSLSTLVFNSTLFVARERGAVGVNTVPFYTLDVKGVAYAPASVTALQSTVISDQIRLRHTQVNTASFAIGTSTLQTASPCNYYNQVHFYNNPTAFFVSTVATPFVSYGPSSLQLNKALFVDANTNIVGAFSSIQGYTSTFYQGGSAFITGTVSTQRVIYNQGYYLDVNVV